MGLRFYVISAAALITSAVVGILLGAVVTTLHSDVTRIETSVITPAADHDVPSQENAPEPRLATVPER
ncbi:hypothetical protein C1701_06710 [Actinoalloteichus sp. AHMU CJ021]|uniref:DUF2613 family protein n=1 Tax=Actinoalloteichus caeruleus DSM 43889 TaxID=1120930 RepID=A0ABT1JHX9_ACTCY|nr:hypothetical protein [Actinoalloteichus caeruleus]AUS78115.1 hypothetical protein C1701_06710 [Actinoalloteichus sp. AHMU CJ021]MCP2332121.1 hypothetical protein [Actinoalloteichus caeruleus DSM 43889]